MPIYKVSGTIEHNWSVLVKADTIEEAEVNALEMAEDGHGLSIPTGEIEVVAVERVED